MDLDCEGFEVGKPNQVWRGDITYIWAGSSWCYLATVIDLYARSIFGWAISEQRDAALTMKALEMAWEQRDKSTGVMFQSDQGSQYGGRLFRQHLWRYRMTQSMSRRGSCWDNAPIERVFRSLRSEWVRSLGYGYIVETSRDISRYLMTHYNWERPINTTMAYHPQRPKKSLTYCPETVDHYSKFHRTNFCVESIANN